MVNIDFRVSSVQSSIMFEFMVVLALVYATASFILLRCPYIIHKKQQNRFRAQHISHRGGAGERIENTLEAFNHAVTLGTNMLELDCHLSKDEEVVVIHDGDLNRATGHKSHVSMLNYLQLPRYRSKVPLDFHPNHYCEVSSVSSDRRIVRLQDLFSAFPTTPMNIDIKVDDDRLIQKVASLTRDYNRESITVWGSFSTEVSEKCKLANPNIPRFFPLYKAVWTIVYYYFGILPFIPLSYEYLELPLLSALNNPLFLAENGCNTWKHRLLLHVLDWIMMSPRMFAHLKARGIPVLFWVCNNEEQYEKAFRAGAEGVMTDYPSRLRAYLLRKKILTSPSSYSYSQQLEGKTKTRQRIRGRGARSVDECNVLVTSHSSSFKLPALTTHREHAHHTELRRVGD